MGTTFDWLWFQEQAEVKDVEVILKEENRFDGSHHFLYIQSQYFPSSGVKVAYYLNIPHQGPLSDSM